VEGWRTAGAEDGGMQHKAQKHNCMQVSPARGCTKHKLSRLSIKHKGCKVCVAARGIDCNAVARLGVGKQREHQCNV
jgi:hypothetical protein